MKLDETPNVRHHYAHVMEHRYELADTHQNTTRRRGVGVAGCSFVAVHAVDPDDSAGRMLGVPCSGDTFITLFVHMMKLSELIQRLQEFQSQHGDLDFSVEALDHRRSTDEDDAMLGHEIVAVRLHKDTAGDFGCLETVTRKP